MQRRGVVKGIDFGATGEVKKVDVARIRERLDAGCIVLLSNLGYSSSGEVLNCKYAMHTLTPPPFWSRTSLVLLFFILSSAECWHGVYDGEIARIKLKLKEDEIDDLYLLHFLEQQYVRGGYSMRTGSWC